MSKDLYQWRKKVLDSVSPSFCAAKWLNASIHLGHGYTHSCHLPIPHPIDEKSFDETVEMLQTSVDKSKLGDKEKSSALKRLHKMAVKGESVGTPIDFLNDLIEGEWKHAEDNGGKTFMGKVVKLSLIHI